MPPKPKPKNKSKAKPSSKKTVKSKSKVKSSISNKVVVRVGSSRKGESVPSAPAVTSVVVQPPMNASPTPIYNPYTSAPPDPTLMAQLADIQSQLRAERPLPSTATSSSQTDGEYRLRVPIKDVDEAGTQTLQPSLTETATQIQPRTRRMRTQTSRKTANQGTQMENIPEPTPMEDVVVAPALGRPVLPVAQGVPFFAVAPGFSIPRPLRRRQASRPIPTVRVEEIVDAPLPLPARSKRLLLPSSPDKLGIPPTAKRLALPPATQPLALPPTSRRLALPPTAQRLALPSSAQRLALPAPNPERRPVVPEQEQNEYMMNQMRARFSPGFVGVKPPAKRRAVPKK